MRQRRAELGQVARETFVPQVYEWGGEAQVDWGLGCTDAAAVRHLLNFGELARPTREDCELHPGLEQYERPLPVMSEYDLLLAAAEAEVVR